MGGADDAAVFGCVLLLVVAEACRVRAVATRPFLCQKVAAAVRIDRSGRRSDGAPDGVACSSAKWRRKGGSEAVRPFPFDMSAGDFLYKLTFFLLVFLSEHGGFR
jgi:hypothetical protein